MLFINTAKLTCEKQKLQGILPVMCFVRLAKDLASKTGEIEYGVQGTIDKSSRPTLIVKLKGELDIVCQRCTAPMSFVVDISTTLTLFMTEDEIEAAELTEPEIEGVIFSDRLDLTNVVEDELILALPYASVHQECSVDQSVKTEEPNTFAKLAALKLKAKPVE